MRLRIISVSMLALLSACGAPPEDISVDCRALQCPSDRDVQEALDLFQDEVPIFDSGLGLNVEWFPNGTVLEVRVDEFGRETLVINQTHSKYDVTVTSFKGLAHELMHVHFWRLFDNPDDDHEDGAGPWSDEANEAIERVETRYLEAGLVL